MEKNFAIPEEGEMLCIPYGVGEWGYSGDRFVRFENGQIIAKQMYASGKETYTSGDERKFRLLRGTRLFHIQMPNNEQDCSIDLPTCCC